MTLASPPPRSSAERSDPDLLRQLSRTGSRDALAAITHRHLRMVYNAALRQTRDRTLADDVTQAVFLLLLQRAPTLPPGTVLAGWLFKATRYTAICAMRSEQRRRNREHRFAHNSASSVDPPAGDAWPEIVPLLDAALARLRPRDRDVVLLRFFEGMEVRQIATALGVGEPRLRAAASS